MSFQRYQNPFSDFSVLSKGVYNSSYRSTQTLPCMQEVEGSTPTGGICPNDFSDPIDQDIRTQWALSWKIVVSEWRSVIAVSLNVGGGVRLIKPAKLCMYTQNTTNTTRTDARRWVCAAMVPYRWATRGTSLRELEYTHTYANIGVASMFL